MYFYLQQIFIQHYIPISIIQTSELNIAIMVGHLPCSRISAVCSDVLYPVKSHLFLITIFGLGPVLLFL